MFTVFAFIASLTAWIVAHQTMLLMVVSILYAFEQWLGSTDKLKSNSTLQLISNFIGGLLKVTGLVYKLSTGKVMVIPTSAQGSATAQPSPVTAAQQIEKAIESPASVLPAGELAVLQQAIAEGGAAMDAALKAP